MSYDYYTGKVLYNNTLDLTDVFYDSTRPTGIILSILMSACGWSDWDKKIFTWAQSEHSSAAVCPLSLECPQGSDSLRHTQNSPTNTVSHEIKQKWTRKEKLSLLSFSLGSVPSFLFSLECPCENLQSWAKLILNHTKNYFLFFVLIQHRHLGRCHCPCQCDLFFIASSF